MFCSRCGKEIADGSVFCNYCGAKQSAPAPAPENKNGISFASSKNKYRSLSLLQQPFCIRHGRQHGRSDAKRC